MGKGACPTSRFYGDAYMICLDCLERNLQQNEEVSNPASASSNTCPTIMAHCVHSTDEEIQMIKDQVFTSPIARITTDIASGIVSSAKLS